MYEKMKLRDCSNIIQNKSNDIEKNCTDIKPFCCHDGDSECPHYLRPHEYGASPESLFRELRQRAFRLPRRLQTEQREC